MLKVVIIDDEPASLDYLKFLVTQNPDLQCVGAFTKPMEALENMGALEPDVVFLDIEMPVILGTDLAQEIRSYDPTIQIIFITAFSQYAVRAFKLQAIHYLLKPISIEDLEEAVGRVLENKRSVIESTSKWEINVMGTFKVSKASSKKSICWPTKKTEELFAYFVYQKNQPVEKSRLWDLLWPELDERKAQHNLHNTIYRIKEIFKKEGFEPPIIYKNNTYQFVIKDFKCDAYLFETFLTKNKVISEDNLLAFEICFQECKGLIFEDKDYEWARGWQLSVWNNYYALGIQLAKIYLHKHEYGTAEIKILRILELQPYDEEAYELLLQVYLESGERVKFLNTYENLIKMLKDEMNLQPRPSTQHLFAQFLEQFKVI